MFGEPPIFHLKSWNHQIETTMLNWMFRVPGTCIELGPKLANTGFHES